MSHIQYAILISKIAPLGNADIINSMTVNLSTPPIYRQRGILRCIFNVHYITKYEGGKIMLLKWQLNNACLFPVFSFKNDILKKFGCRFAVSLIQTKKLIFFKTSSRVGAKTETSLTLFVYQLII